MKTFIILLFFLSAQSIFAQKEDNVWLVSHTYGSLDATQLDFNSSPVTIETVQREMFLSGTNASISDEDGNLLLYTNGRKIANSNGEILENGDSLNYGFWYDNFGNFGYNIPQAAFFIPKPGDDSKIFLFHMFLDFVNGTIPMSPRYSVIDMDANNGQGKVTEKNVELLSANAALNFIQATAVRHANGRDWWIMVPNHMGPQYYRFLLTPDGVEGPWEQEIGFREATTDFFANGFGQRVFSPDGSQFADYDYDNFTQVFDFDRCTGLLSNARLLEHTIDPSLNNAGASVTFSSSSRYLYITAVDNGHTLFQYDTEASDLLASEKVIYHCPLVNQQFECGLLNMRLAPDGKIYISGSDDTISFSIIHQPDSLGFACDFELGGLVFPLAYPGAYFPYWPNYRLGALEGSSCDTITSAVNPVVNNGGSMHFVPNPAITESTVEYQLPANSIGEIVVTNILGVKQASYTLTEGSNRVSIGKFPTGIYFVTMLVNGEAVQTQKLILQ